MRRARAFLAVWLIGVFLGTVAANSTLAAFTDTTSNTGNTFAAAADFGGSGVNFVKSVGTASCGNNSNSLSIPAGGIAVGNTIIARLAHRTTNPGAVTINDSNGNNYTKDADVQQGQIRIVVFSAYVTKALAQNDQITVTFPAAGDAVGLTVEEYTGIVSTNRVDVVGTGTGESTTPTATVTTTSSHNLLYGAIASFNNRTYTEAASWNTGTHQAISCGGATNKADNHGAARDVITAGTFTYQPTISASEKWAAAVVAYRAAEGAAACNRPASTYLSGYEYGPVAAGTIGMADAVGFSGGIPIIESAVTRSGTYSLKIPKTNTGTSYVSKNLPSSTIVNRLAIRLPSLPSADVTKLMSIQPAAGNSLNLGYNASQNKFKIAFGTGTPATASSVVTAGTWHLIEIKVAMAANPRLASWQIDGVEQAQATSAEAASSVAAVRLGSDVTADVFTAHFDDVLASSNSADYPMGEGRVLALRPDGMSSHSSQSNFSNNDGSGISPFSFQRLDDNPMNSTADYIRQTGAAAGGYIGITFADPPQSCIRGVSGVVALSSGGGPGGNNGKTSIFDGGTERIVYSGDMTTGGAALGYREAVISPFGSVWSQGAVSGLIARIGYSTDVAPEPRWHALMLEYETQS